MLNRKSGMEVDWKAARLSHDFLHSPEFWTRLWVNLEEIYPADGIDGSWAAYYDTWHRHITPLSDFLLPIDEAIEKFGLLHYSGDENPIELQNHYDKMNFDSEFKALLGSNAVQNVKNARDDDIYRLAFQAKVGNDKYDIRRYMLMHHCWNNAKMIYLAMCHIYPGKKWRVIVSSSHATVTDGTIEQLQDYLYSGGPGDFSIAEPLFTELKGLMPSPQTWRSLESKDDIMNMG